MIKKYQKVVIFGTFDVIHPGHIVLFKYAKQLAQKLYLIVARDQNVNKDTPLLFNEEQRQKQLSQYSIIDKIVLGDLDNPLSFYQQLKPDLVVLGYDQSQNVDLLKQIPVVVQRAPNFHPELFKSRKIKNIIRDSSANFYLINKTKGSTSFKIVSILRKVLNMKKIGFAGTLDPLATGLMILASGKATKFLDAFHLLNKVYEARIELGKISNTFDAEGTVNIVKQMKAPQRKKIIEVLKEKFTGSILQIPPIFSAKKIHGQKAYDLARQNKEFVLKAVPITIKKIKILKYKYPFLDLQIDCSKGSYIRSIAHDLGQELKTGAILKELKRSQIGPFNLNNSLKQDRISSNSLLKNKLDILQILTIMNQYFLVKK